MVFRFKAYYCFSVRAELLSMLHVAWLDSNESSISASRTADRRRCANAARRCERLHTVSATATPFADSGGTQNQWQGRVFRQDVKGTGFAPGGKLSADA